jgi:hypothetical protein
MLYVRRSDIRALYARFRQHSDGFGWNWDMLNVDWDWKCLLKNLKKARPPRGALSMEKILDACGLEDALWAMGAVEGYRNAMRLFACRCADEALASIERSHPERAVLLRDCLDIARRHARGDAGKVELTAVRDRLWGILNPDPDVCVVHDGGRTCYGKRSARNIFEHDRHDLELESAMLAVLAALREDSGDGARNAARHAVSAVSFQVIDALREGRVAEGADLERTAGAVADAARNAVETLAGEISAALSAITDRPPDRDALINGALAAVRGAVGGKPFGNSSLFRVFSRKVEEAVVKAEKDGLAVECRKLCRLDGEYGEVGEA